MHPQGLVSLCNGSTSLVGWLPPVGSNKRQADFGASYGQPGTSASFIARLMPSVSMLQSALTVYQLFGDLCIIKSFRFCGMELEARYHKVDWVTFSSRPSWDCHLYVPLKPLNNQSSSYVIKARLAMSIQKGTKRQHSGLENALQFSKLKYHYKYNQPGTLRYVVKFKV